MKIVKFGGSSLVSPEKLKIVSEYLQHASSQGEQPVVVASAISDVTDQLIKLSEEAALSETPESFRSRILSALEPYIAGSEEVLGDSAKREFETWFGLEINRLDNLFRGVQLLLEVTDRIQAYILSFAETIAANLLKNYLVEQGIAADFVDARNLIISDKNFLKAKVNEQVSAENIQEVIKGANKISVINGAVAASDKGETTFLGRGGGDYTASLLAVALGASEIQLWSSVPGVMSADPKQVEKAFSIPKLSYEEAFELSHFGAKVIHPQALLPAADASIPIRVIQTSTESLEAFKSGKSNFGTCISAEPSESQYQIAGISSLSNVSLLWVEGNGLLGISGMMERLFQALNSADINVILVSQASTEHSGCVALRKDDVDSALAAVRSEFSVELEAKAIKKLEVEHDYSAIAVVGQNMAKVPGLAGHFFGALGRNGINISVIAQGASEVNISALIPAKDENKALNVIHDVFFKFGRITLNVFVVGVGQVGATFLKQLAYEDKALERAHLDLRLAGICRSSSHLLSKTGIKKDSWEAQLSEKGEQGTVSEFVEKMIELNLSHSVFVDCTASEEVALEYEKILASSISIVTPNKRANSGSFERYNRLKEVARHANVKFFYETNVGAGLPVIGTLNDLMLSGDEVLRIEAVLSGTLSYLFNSFDGSRPFSEIVRGAKEQGFTEPDPREDLSGQDVARKLLILAREMGVGLEEKDLEVESLIPSCTEGASSVDEFLTALANADSEFQQRLEGAQREGGALRYIGKIEEGKASVSLEAIGAGHPFYSLSGTDNIISFTTRRYINTPLVVKGPGAGTDVTAAGVFADVIRVGSYLM